MPFKIKTKKHNHINKFTALCGGVGALVIFIAALGPSSYGKQVWGKWDLISLTRDRTHVPCIGRQIPNHWTIKEVPRKAFWLPSREKRGGERNEGRKMDARYNSFLTEERKFKCTTDEQRSQN